MKLKDKIILSQEDFEGSTNTLNDIFNTFKEVIKKRTGLSNENLFNVWSDFLSDLNGDSWKYELVDTIEDFLDLFIVFQNDMRRGPGRLLRRPDIRLVY